MIKKSIYSFVILLAWLIIYIGPPPVRMEILFSPENILPDVTILMHEWGKVITNLDPIEVHYPIRWEEMVGVLLFTAVLAGFFYALKRRQHLFLKSLCYGSCLFAFVFYVAALAIMEPMHREFELGFPAKANCYMQKTEAISQEVAAYQDLPADQFPEDLGPRYAKTMQEAEEACSKLSPFTAEWHSMEELDKLLEDALKAEHD